MAPITKAIGDKVTKKIRKVKKRTVQVASDVESESEPVSYYFCFRSKIFSTSIILLFFLRNHLRRKSVRLHQTRTISWTLRTRPYTHRSTQMTSKTCNQILIKSLRSLLNMNLISVTLCLFSFLVLIPTKNPLCHIIPTPHFTTCASEG